MIIKIDIREPELLLKCRNCISTTLKYVNLTIESVSLPLGDVIINDGISDNIIIERKTLSDLASSIKDGRYDEQSYRLSGISHHNHNIIYLVEGDMMKCNTFKDKLDKQTLYSAMFSINYFKGFSLMRSMSVEESAVIICNMAYKINQYKTEKNKVGYYINELENLSDKDNIECNNLNNETNDLTQIAKEKQYCSVVKQTKKDNITINNIGEIMLCQIPSISACTALAILNKFKTITNLIKHIELDESCLNDICIQDVNGKARKISKQSIANIFKFLRI